MGRTKKILMAAAAVTAVAAAGSAFTAGISGFPTAQINGYGETAITGGTVTNVAYQYDPASNSTVTAVAVTFTGDLDGTKTIVSSSTAYTFAATWSDGALGVNPIDSVVVHSADVSVANYGGVSTVVTFTPSTPVSVADLTKFSVLVSQDGI
jgi:hypothetical protein